MKKISGRLVPKILRNDEKLTRVTLAKQFLDKYKQNWNGFRERFVTCDETWIHYYIPEKKRYTREWTRPGEKRPKIAKAEKSIGKIMAPFCDSRGIIFADYDPRGQPITG